MLIATGTVLVLLSWCLAAAGIVCLGLLPALAIDTRSRRLPILRSAIWWGLLVIALAVMALNAVTPLHSAAAGWSVLALMLALGVPGWLRFRRRQPAQRRVTRSWWWAASALLAAQVYLGLAALGPVTNYDSGLYHLGAIAYSADFSTIPGLANLYAPLGYGTAQFPLAAILGNGPWGAEGFRLLNGLILFLVAIDFAVRAMARRRGPGFYVMLAGLSALWIPMVALSDYWVTSPSQDSASAALAVVTVSYLADTVAGTKRWVADAATTAIVGLVLVLFRTTMAGFVAAVGVVLIAVVVRRRKVSADHRGRATALVVSAVAVSAVVFSARDYLLSGWLQYPLSIHAFDVPWRAVDPTALRTATLGFHRDSTQMWSSSDGWEWIRPWLSHLAENWEVWEALLMAGVAIVVCAIAGRSVLRPHRWRAVAVLMVPSAFAVAAWWIASPPAFRFVWGPLFTLLAVPIGWSLWLLSDEASPSPRRWRGIAVAGLAIPLIAVTFFSVTVRFDWDSVASERTWQAGIGIPYAVTPVVDAAVGQHVLPSGLAILVPRRTDQCWVNYPLCTPSTSSSLRLRGESLATGFLP